MTGTKVTTIRTGENMVEVVTDQGTFTGKHVIVTASLGVLKSGMITFEPQLPQWKLDAIDAQGWTNYAKVYCAWDKQWWTEDDFGESDEDMTAWVSLMDAGEANN